ncbi:hypothetical protein RchiOBHm_Chr6g0259421 [Rosa chinensis]|uniref:Uncharacterized protein n=1 Tax=Rosa chinensis TaxID=74649 RepID=A0A2P6PMW3_ROSCH|nr:hypothetical protein RchiOBHm_Chr6g0259421 [Rosa chinensis]
MTIDNTVFILILIVNLMSFLPITTMGYSLLPQARFKICNPCDLFISFAHAIHKKLGFQIGTYMELILLRLACVPFLSSMFGATCVTSL